MTDEAGGVAPVARRDRDAVGVDYIEDGRVGSLGQLLQFAVEAARGGLAVVGKGGAHVRKFREYAREQAEFLQLAFQ